MHIERSYTARESIRESGSEATALLGAGADLDEGRRHDREVAAAGQSVSAARDEQFRYVRAVGNSEALFAARRDDLVVLAVDVLRGGSASPA